MNPTINFMFFAFNFHWQHITALLKILGNEEHHKNKLFNSKGENGTDKFIHWFMELSESNKELVTQYIDKNYSYKI